MTSYSHWIRPKPQCLEKLLSTSTEAGQSRAPWCPATVNAAVIAALWLFAVHRESSPPDLDDFHDQTWHSKIIGYKDTNFTKVSVGSEIKKKKKVLLMSMAICRSPLLQRESRHSQHFTKWFINCVSEGSCNFPMKPLEQHFTKDKYRTQDKEGIICLFESAVSVCAVPTGTCPGL